MSVDRYGNLMTAESEIIDYYRGSCNFIFGQTLLPMLPAVPVGRILEVLHLMVASNQAPGTGIFLFSATDGEGPVITIGRSTIVTALGPPVVFSNDGTTIVASDVRWPVPIGETPSVGLFPGFPNSANESLYVQIVGRLLPPTNVQAQQG